MSGHHPPVVSGSGRNPAPRSAGRNGNSIVAPLVPDPSSVDEAEAILKQMARAVSLKDTSAVAVRPASVRARSSEADKRPSGAKQRGPAFQPSERLVRSLVELAPEALVMIDREGTILLVNSQTEELFGYGRDELLGEKIEILIPERFREGHVIDRERYFQHPEARPMASGLALGAAERTAWSFRSKSA